MLIPEKVLSALKAEQVKILEHAEKLGKEIEALEKAEELDLYLMQYQYGVPVTKALFDRFLPETVSRYDWDDILEKVPNAVCATTDENGRKDVWLSVPEVGSTSWAYGSLANVISRPSEPTLVSDWKQSLEFAPKFKEYQK